MSLSREEAFQNYVKTDDLKSLRQLLADHPEQDFPTFNMILFAVEFGSLPLLQYLFNTRKIEKNLHFLWLVNFNERQDVNDFIIELCLKEYPWLMHLRKGNFKEAIKFPPISLPSEQHPESLLAPVSFMLRLDYLYAVHEQDRAALDQNHEHFERLYLDLKTTFDAAQQYKLIDSNRLNDFIVIYNKKRPLTARVLISYGKILLLNGISFCLKSSDAEGDENVLQDAVRQIDAMLEYPDSQFLMHRVRILEGLLLRYLVKNDREISGVVISRYKRELYIFQQTRDYKELFEAVGNLYLVYKSNFKKRRASASELVGAIVHYLEHEGSEKSELLLNAYAQNFCDDMIECSADCVPEKYCYQNIHLLLTELRRIRHGMNTPGPRPTIVLNEVLAMLHSMLKTNDVSTRDRQQVAASRLVRLLVACFAEIKDTVNFKFSKSIGKNTQLNGFLEELKILSPKFQTLSNRVKGIAMEVVVKQVGTHEFRIRKLEEASLASRSAALPNARISTYPLTLYGNSSTTTSSPKTSNESGQMQTRKRPRRNSQ